MSDLIENLFHERLAGHEADVPAGAWEHISGQLASAAAGTSLHESLQGKFQAHEVPVPPSAWAHISSQLGHAGAAAAGPGLRFGWIAAGTAAVVATAGLLFLARQTNPALPVLPAQPRMVQAAPEQPVPGATATDHQRVAMPAIPQAPQVAAKRAAAGNASARTGPAETAMPPQHAEAPTADAPQAAPTQAVLARQAEEPATTAGPTTPASGKESPAATVPNAAQPGQEHGAKRDAAKAGTESSPSDPATAAADPFHRNMDSGIMIPNAFSPQGDGVNDVLEIVASGYERADVRVISVQTGMLVFQTNDLANRWDGRLANGSNAEEGYYRCVVILANKDGRQRVQTEVVRLFR